MPVTLDRLVVVGGSAGAQPPLRTVLAGLPPDFPAPVLVTMHLAAGSTSKLPELLDADTPLTVRHARHGEALAAGIVLVAPPDRHLVVRDDVVHLSRGPRENRHRPAVDPMFTTAARWHGPAVAGVVLSGALDDGAAGAAAIAAQDGHVIVQAPDEARVSAMPVAAIAAVRRAQVVRAAEIAPLLDQWARKLAPTDRPPSDSLIRWESDNVDPSATRRSPAATGSPTALACPDCHGGMFEVTGAGEQPHYVCHVGHSWSPESLMDAQRQASETALYAAAAKLLEESCVLRRLVETTQPAPRDDVDELETRARRAERQAAMIQDMIEDGDH